MRTLKFRIWNTKGKCFYTSDHVKANFFNFIEKMPDQPIMQFTGLLDRHGKEIYDGDVLKCEDGTKHAVGWNTDYVCFCLSNREYIGLNRQDLAECYEVTGDIYSNPDLL